VVGGILAGPFVLGVLPEASLDALGGIGILYLMFMAGVELDLNLFKRYRSAAITFSLLTFTAPFLFSLWVSHQFMGLSLIASILMGAVWASHTLVAYPIVRETGLASNKAVATAVGSTAITDTLALLALAMVSGTAGDDAGAGNSSEFLILLKLGVGLGFLLAYSLLFIPWLARRFFAGPGQERILRFVFVLGALTSAGLFAEMMGIEGIVGAFFAGLGLNRLIPNGGRLMEQTEFFGSALFVPAFLVSVGMLIDPAVLLSLSTIKMALMFAAALAAGKLLAAIIAGWRFKFSGAEIGVMFSLTLGQAAATLASTMVGLKLGLFTEDVVNAVLLVVLVSLVATSLGTRFFAHRVSPEALVVQPIGNSIMVPIRFGPTLQRTMALAAEIAQADAGLGAIVDGI
jgi:Kef-type K+ transport system membrane component KefB